MTPLEALFPIAVAERWARTDRPDPYWSPTRAAARPSRGIFRRLADLLGVFSCSVIFGILLGLVLAVGLPYLVHGRSFTVMTGSMEPTISVGDVIVAQRISPLGARVGDIITFKDPQGSSRVFTHRVRGIKVSRGWLHFVTKGDANNHSERWAIRADGSMGRVRYRLPHLGYVLWYMHSFWGRIAFLIAPLCVLALVALRRIWR